MDYLFYNPIKIFARRSNPATEIALQILLHISKIIKSAGFFFSYVTAWSDAAALETEVWKAGYLGYLAQSDGIPTQTSILWAGSVFKPPFCQFPKHFPEAGEIAAWWGLSTGHQRVF